MLDAYKEDVMVAVPTGGQVDPLTRERVGSGGAATLTTVSVVWVVNPQKQIVLDQQSGAFLGTIKTADCAALYQRSGGPNDVDWNAFLKPGVVVTRKGVKYSIVAVSDSPFTPGVQVIGLKLQEGGNAGA